MDGVFHTRVGYAGGTTGSPTYHDLDSHSETVQLDFDPARLTYTEVLGVFWQSHNPARESYSRQYASIIFYHNDAQKLLAMETKSQQETMSRTKISTEIMPVNGFHLAEDYHQKYYLRQVPEIMKDFNAFYPDDLANFVDSTAAARINGFLGGNGTYESLEAQLPGFGLSPEAQWKLLEIGRNRLPSLAVRRRR